MSETKTSAQKQHSALLAAPCTRKVLEEMLGSARFQDVVEGIVRYGKDDVLEAVNDMCVYMGQCVLITESSPPSITSDHFYLMQLFYEFTRSIPADDLQEAEIKDLKARQRSLAS